MRMAAMLVMDVAVLIPVVIMTMIMIVMRDMGVRMRLLVVIVGPSCSQRHRR